VVSILCVGEFLFLQHSSNASKCLEALSFNPLRRGISFLTLLFLFVLIAASLVSIPCVGEFLFLHQWRALSQIAQYSFNPLRRGISFLTGVYTTPLDSDR